MSKRKNLYLMIGAPGCGKSTWVREQIKNNNGIHISRDKIRFDLVSEQEDYFSKEDEVFFAWISQIQSAINNVNGSDDIYLDATHISTGSRMKTLTRLNLDNVQQIYAVEIHCSLEDCLTRNAIRQNRERVPDSAVKNMYKNLTFPKNREGKIDYKIIHVYN